MKSSFVKLIPLRLTNLQYLMNKGPGGKIYLFCNLLLWIKEVISYQYTTEGK